MSEYIRWFEELDSVLRVLRRVARFDRGKGRSRLTAENGLRDKHPAQIWLLTTLI